MDDERQAYSDEYAAEHGRFALIPAAYVFLLDGERGEAGERVLLQRRAGTGYYDDWWAAAAAGHVEQGESVFAAALRETAEELGVDVVEAALEPLTAMHRTGGTGRPVDERLDVFFACRSWQGTPALMEQKATGLEWFPLDALPEHVVHHERFVLEGYRDGTLLPLTAYGFGGEPGIADAVGGVDATDGAGGPAASPTDAGRSLWSSLGFTEQPDWRRWVKTPWSS